jgi:hypothetical protein
MRREICVAIQLGTKLGDYVIAYTLPDSKEETHEP